MLFWEERKTKIPSISPNYHASQFFFFFYFYSILLIVDYIIQEHVPAHLHFHGGEACLALWLTLVLWGVVLPYCLYILPGHVIYFAFVLLCHVRSSSPTRDQTPLLPPVAAWKVLTTGLPGSPRFALTMGWREQRLKVHLSHWLALLYLCYATERAPSAWAPGQTRVEQTQVQPTSGAKTQLNHSKVTSRHKRNKHLLFVMRQ